MTIQSFDGKQIHIHEWTTESPRAIIQIVHGMAEHAARYEKFAKYLNDHGFFVVADDHRGHGNTDPDTLGYADGDMFADTVRDEAVITDFYQKRYVGLPYFILGFSYGSFLTQSYISKYGEKLTGAIIAGSNHKKDFEVYLGSLVAGAGCLFGKAKKPAKLIEKLSFGAYAKKFSDGEWLSIDAENNAAYHADPQCGFTCSYRFYADFFRGLKSLYTKKYCAGLRHDLPILLISGKDDPVGDMGKGVEKLAKFYREKAGVKQVQVALFENSRHEFLNEEDNRATKWKTVLHFIEKNSGLVVD